MGGADPVDQTQIKSRCLQGGCFSSQDPKPPQRNRVHGCLLSRLHIAVGEGLHTISGNLHRPLKVRSFLFFFFSPATLQSTPNERESQRRAERGCRNTIICQATLSFIGLCFRSPCPRMRERDLTHTQAFRLLSHWRGVYTPFSHLVTTTGSTVCNEVLEFSSKG